MESMLLAGAHQNAKTISMLSTMIGAEEGTPGPDVVMGARHWFGVRPSNLSRVLGCGGRRREF